MEALKSKSEDRGTVKGGGAGEVEVNSVTLGVKIQQNENILEQFSNNNNSNVKMYK